MDGASAGSDKLAAGDTPGRAGLQDSDEDDTLG